MFCTAVLCVAVFAACAPPQDSNSEVTGSSGSAGLIPAGRMDLLYADQFSVDYYEGGYSLVTIKDSGEFLLVPEGAAVPEGLSEDTIILQLPLQNIYLAASAAMDLFRKLGALDSVRMTGTKASDWAIPEIAEMVESGQISYGGKYSAPDYEMLLSNSCDLAIESTMIY
ncbi:MAG: ABC transporter substrate-binding protein, partial [Lachnospiraceae bacterium]|nr:ABC transporter substrate-binding protein [Lachnospiraceae bacterium]